MAMQGGGTITLQQIINHWNYWYNQITASGAYPGNWSGRPYPGSNTTLLSYRGSAAWYGPAADGNSIYSPMSGGTITLMQFYGKSPYAEWNCNCDCANCTNCGGY